MKVMNNTVESHCIAVQLDINKEWRAEAVSSAPSGMTQEGLSILCQGNTDEDVRVTDGKKRNTLEQKQYTEDILILSDWFHIILFYWVHITDTFVKILLFFYRNYILWKAAPVSPSLSNLQILTSPAKIWQEY